MPGSVRTPCSAQSSPPECDTDGRLLALNSFENRVYQVGVEDASPLVAKFYRGGRWSDAAIEEEHAFALELREAELPVVAPLRFDGATLLRFGGQRFALYPRQGGRAPELESADNLAWMGRLLARLHVRRRTRPLPGARHTRSRHVDHGAGARRACLAVVAGDVARPLCARHRNAR